MAKHITSTETDNGWLITLPSGGSIEVDIYEVDILRNYLTRLMEPADFKGKVRNKWKQIVVNGYKLRDAENNRIALIQAGVDPTEVFIQWEGKKHMTVISDDFIKALRKADQDKATEFFKKYEKG